MSSYALVVSSTVYAVIISAFVFYRGAAHSTSPVINLNQQTTRLKTQPQQPKHDESPANVIQLFNKSTKPPQNSPLLLPYELRQQIMELVHQIASSPSPLPYSSYDDPRRQSFQAPAETCKQMRRDALQTVPYNLVFHLKAEMWECMMNCSPDYRRGMRILRIEETRETWTMLGGDHGSTQFVCRGLERPFCHCGYHKWHKWD